MARDFDDNEFPLAYLITFRCFGTWLHGDPHGSVDRQRNIYGTPPIVPNARLEKTEMEHMKHPDVVLDLNQRNIVEIAIREVCQFRGYLLQAINVRTNHVHCVVSAPCAPEPIMGAFKSYSTRALRKAGAISSEVRPWARHGSTRYLWREQHVERAVDYVLNGQGDAPPVFD